MKWQTAGVLHEQATVIQAFDILFIYLFVCLVVLFPATPAICGQRNVGVFYKT
jgi:hypothetical protein